MHADWLARRWLAKYYSPPLRWIIVKYDNHFWALQTQYSVFITVFSTVHVVTFTVSVLCETLLICEIISKKYYKCRVEKFFAGFLTRFLSWYCEEIDMIYTVFLRRWVLCDDRWMPTSLPEEYSASGSPVTLLLPVTRCYNCDHKDWLKYQICSLNTLSICRHNCTLQCKQFVMYPNQVTPLSLPSHTKVAILFEMWVQKPWIRESRV